MPGHAVVVGAGLAGLTAAWALSRAGARVTVFEAAERAGGDLAAEPVGRFCWGGRDFALPAPAALPWIWRRDRATRRLLDTLGATGELISTPVTEQILGRRVLRLGARARASALPEPLGWLEALVEEPALAAAGTLKAALRVLAGAPEGAAGGDAAALLEGLGEPARALLEGWLEQCFERPPGAVSLGQALAALERRGAADVRDRERAALRRAPSLALIGRMERAIAEAGGQLLTHSPVERIERALGRAVGVWARGWGSVRADGLVLAAGAGLERLLEAAPGLLPPPPPLRSRPAGAALWFAGAPAAGRAPAGRIGGVGFAWLSALRRDQQPWCRASGGSALALWPVRDLEAARRVAEVAWPELAGTFVAGCRAPRAPARPAPPGGVPAAAAPGLALAGGWTVDLPPGLEASVTSGLAAAAALAGPLGLDPALLPGPLPPPDAPTVFLRLRGLVRGAGSRWAW